MQTAKTLIRLGGHPGDPSLRWAHTHFVGFIMSQLIFEPFHEKRDVSCSL